MDTTSETRPNIEVEFATIFQELRNFGEEYEVKLKPESKPDTSRNIIYPL